MLATVWEVDTVYRPYPPIFCCTILVPETIPVPLIYCPVDSTPEIAVTVRSLLLVDLVAVAVNDGGPPEIIALSLEERVTADNV